MKKLLAVLVIAAIVGIAISNRQAPVRQADAGPATPAGQDDAAGGGRPPSVGSAAADGPHSTAVAPTPQDVPARLQSLRASPGQPTAPEAPPEGPAAGDGSVPGSDTPGSRVLEAVERAGALLDIGERVEARAVLTELYLDARGDLARLLKESLDRINAELVLNPRCLQGGELYVVEPGDMLSKVGRKLGVNWRMIQRLNGLSDSDVTRLRVGQRLKVWQGTPSVVAWRGEFRMALLWNGAYVKEYPIGVGVDERTPIGAFEVTDMLVNPPWFPPGGGMIPYGDPRHLLGDRWIGFRNEPGASGLGIHGTNDPHSIGTKCSNGCLRMHNEDVAELYDFLVPGTMVEVRS
jgi:hypothetical protein